MNRYLIFCPDCPQWFFSVGFIDTPVIDTECPCCKKEITGILLQQDCDIVLGIAPMHAAQIIDVERQHLSFETYAAMVLTVLGSMDLAIDDVGTSCGEMIEKISKGEYVSLKDMIEKALSYKKTREMVDND